MLLPTEPTAFTLLDIEPGSEESFETLLAGAAFRLERIVSRGAATPEGSWYDQGRSEWVALLAGTATLELRDGSRIDLAPGDGLLLPAHFAHRVAATSKDAIWLALHFLPAPEPPRATG
jgi:cupin 2 domain-containing protein